VNEMNLSHHTTTLCRAHSGVIPKLLFTDKQLHPSSLCSDYDQAP